MNVEDVLGAFSLVDNPIVLSEEEVKDVQKAIKQLQEENKKLSREIDMWNKKYNDVFDENKQLKEIINSIAKCFNDGHFEDGCDCLIIEKYIDSYLEKVSE